MASFRLLICESIRIKRPFTLYDQFVLLLTGSHKFSELSPHQVDSLVRFNFDASVLLESVIVMCNYMYIHCALSFTRYESAKKALLELLSKRKTKEAS